MKLVNITQTLTLSETWFIDPSENQITIPNGQYRVDNCT